MLCHVSEDSRRGKRRLREAEASASAVGGPAGRPCRLPPNPLLFRFENVARAFSRASAHTRSRAERDHDTFATDIILERLRHGPVEHRRLGWALGRLSRA
jgi:hypothetical protein